MWAVSNNANCSCQRGSHYRYYKYSSANFNRVGYVKTWKKRLLNDK